MEEDDSDDKTAWIPVRGWWDSTGGPEIEEWLKKAVSPGWAWVERHRSGRWRKVVFDYCHAGKAGGTPRILGNAS